METIVANFVGTNRGGRQEKVGEKHPMFKLGQFIKKIKTKSGREVVVRVIDEKDLKSQLKFINELVAEDTFIIYPPGKKFTLAEEKKWLNTRIKGVKNKEGLHFCVFFKERLIGNLEVNRKKGRGRHVGEVGISISRGFRDEGIGQELLKIAIQEAKKEGFKILYLGVFANNRRAIHVYQKLGFKKIGTLPKAWLYKGKYVDDVMMCLEL